MSEILPKITIMIGPPGVGKTTILERIKSLDGYACHNGDDFISLKGIKRLQDNTWGDDDRREYLGLMAIGVTKNAKPGERTIVVDAMTTKWMREYFETEVRTLGNFTLAWVKVTRQFTDAEIDELIAERLAAGHPINSRVVFQRFHDAFELIIQDHFILENPGPQAGEEALINTIKTLLLQIYES